MKISRRLSEVLTWLLPPCREVVRWTSQDLDGQLRWHQHARMQVHLLICALCKRYRQQLIMLCSAVNSHPENLIDGGDALLLSPEVKQQIKDVLQKATPPTPKM